jgi:hypothetical protein
VNGSGKHQSEARSVRGFNQVEINGIGQLALTQGNQDSLAIEGDDNILPLLTSQVSDGVLHLGAKDGTTIRPSVPIVYHLTMRDIAGIQQTGLANIEAGSIESDHLHLSVGGPGSIKIGQLHAQSLAVATGGSGSMSLAGNVGDQRVQVVGAGDYRADQLWSQDARVAIQGSANCAVRVAGTLAASIVGAGTITYAGAPSISRQIVGVGTVTPA